MSSANGDNTSRLVSTAPCSPGLHTLPDEHVYDGMVMSGYLTPKEKLDKLKEGRGVDSEVLVVTYPRSGIFTVTLEFGGKQNTIIGQVISLSAPVGRQGPLKTHTKIMLLLLLLLLLMTDYSILGIV